jgi:hypothetical protein
MDNTYEKYNRETLLFRREAVKLKIENSRGEVPRKIRKEACRKIRKEAYRKIRKEAY